jgi:hypothetical protein
MPNWCANTVTLRHADPAMIARAKEAFVQGKFLNEFVPIPESLHIVAGSVGEQDRAAHEAQMKANLDAHGYKDWYDFSVSEWGTKWDVGDGDGINDVQSNELTVFFESAWAPPIGAYEKMTAMGFEIEAMYDEPGMAFAGVWSSEDGDDFYEYGGMSSDQAAEQLPKQLDEAFSISENISYMEEEQQDD